MDGCLLWLFNLPGSMPPQCWGNPSDKSPACWCYAASHGPTVDLFARHRLRDVCLPVLFRADCFHLPSSLLVFIILRQFATVQQGATVELRPAPPTSLAAPLPLPSLRLCLPCRHVSWIFSASSTIAPAAGSLMRRPGVRIPLPPVPKAAPGKIMTGNYWSSTPKVSSASVAQPKQVASEFEREWGLRGS